MTIKENDFIEVDYTGKIAETGEVFDTTRQDVAEKSGLAEPGRTFKPIIIQVGKQHVLEGMEKQLIGKDLGTHQLHLKTEEAFGKKDAKLIQLVATSKFRQQDVHPVPGLHVNIDGNVGVIKTVTGGRTLVDMNHPLAGKDIDYEVEVRRIVTDPKEQLEGLLNIMGLPSKVTLAEGKAAVELPMKFPEELTRRLSEDITKSIPAIASVEFSEKKQ